MWQSVHCIFLLLENEFSSARASCHSFLYLELYIQHTLSCSINISWTNEWMKKSTFSTSRRLPPVALSLYSSTCATASLLLPLRQQWFHPKKLHQRENSRHHTTEAHTHPCLCSLLPRAQKAAGFWGRIYFGPQQKRVGDSVSKDGNSWTWCGDSRPTLLRISSVLWAAGADFTAVLSLKHCCKKAAVGCSS